MKYSKDIIFSIIIGFLGFKIFSIQEELNKINNTLKKVKLNFAYENHDHSLSAENIDYNEYENGSTWHQDNYAGKAPIGDDYLNLAISIDDADESNGALQIVPKSHKLGDLPCNPKPNFSYDDQGRRYNSAPIGNNCELPDLPVLQLEYEAGDVIVVHSQLVHKADKNQHSNRWRRTMYFVYINDGSSFWPGWTAKRQLLDRYDWS